MTARNRGPRWTSPKQADRGRKLRSFSLSPDVHAALDEAVAQKRNISADADTALRRFYGLPENAPPDDAAE